ncbi:trypsin-like [Prorops nasuta]|uniref:trypsin-like n=1 Tax=Prorops nasuta TaxID=863751 RepID=UPI0034CD08CD
MAAIMLKHNRTIPQVYDWLKNKYRPLYPSHDFHCNGVIISRRFVLTTAACILNKTSEVDKIRIRTGTNSLWDNEGETHEVQSYHVHNMTRIDSHITVVYTIGVYRLKKRLKVTNNQKPLRFAALPEAIIIRDPWEIDIAFSGDWYGTVVGWGKERPLGPATNVSPPPQYTVFTLRKMQETVVIERVPRCKRFIEQNGIPFNGHEICGYIHEKIGNDGAVLVYDNSLVGVAIHYRYEFYNGVKQRLTYGSIFAYIKKLESFINATVTDYYS